MVVKITPYGLSLEEMFDHILTFNPRSASPFRVLLGGPAAQSEQKVSSRRTVTVSRSVVAFKTKKC